MTLAFLFVIREEVLSNFMEILIFKKYPWYQKHVSMTDINIFE